MKLGVLFGALALSLTASAFVPAQAEAAHRHDRFCRHDGSRGYSRYEGRGDRYRDHDRYDRRDRRSYRDGRYRYGYGDSRYGYGYDYGYDYRHRRSYYGPHIDVRPFVYVSPWRPHHRRYWGPRLGVHIGGPHVGVYLGF
jgi:hypothetical protein